RVYVFGHSNGGFMAFRLACDHGDQIAAIASFAGEMWKDPSKCKGGAPVPVPVLQIQGTADGTVDYTGTASYPGAVATVSDWAKFDKCPPGVDKSHPPLDLDASIPGPETSVQINKGCTQSTEV